MNAIYASGLNGEFALEDGTLPWKKNSSLQKECKEDMDFFKRTTNGKIVVMGSNTLESLPDGKPLPDRMNIVLTRDKTKKSKYNNLKYMNSVEEIVRYCEGKKCFCIGGESVYRQFLPYCKRAYITHVLSKKPADSHFPCDLSLSQTWNEVYASSFHAYKNIIYQFRTYENTHVKY